MNQYSYNLYFKTNFEHKMKTLLILCVFIASSTTTPVPNTNTDAQADIIQLDNTNDGKGNYEFRY